ncbi:FAD-dependent monooxygenase [Streptomyces mirabilis]|uniref:FAD-dependent monooxygenase n=1 Tax=Streptomyces mirabilis TaxID=68239 RepID=UPI0033DFC0FB
MDASVIVVGSGPAGLMLAGELRLAGIDVIVLERLRQRTGQSRAIGFTIRTMELFDQRGLLPRFGEIETSPHGHFGGVPLNLGVLGTAHDGARTVPQSLTERVLEGWVRDLGVTVRQGQEFVRLSEDADGVDVFVEGAHRPLRARYLVGCDGGRSAVRKAAGFDFPGKASTTELFVADVRGIDLDPKMTGMQVPGGMVMSAKLPGDIWRLIMNERDAPPRERPVPPSFDEIADVWKRLTGIDIAHGRPVWLNAFGDASRQITEYRRGRVLLAGDAAHVHLPAGGQGMNTSIQDSFNLGWKLAAVLKSDPGGAPSALLDTYHDERHPVGRRLLANTEAQRALILGSAEVGPLREVLAELTAYPEVERHLAAKVTGLDIRYDVGGGTHPQLGMRMPHLELIRDGHATSTTRLLRPARGVLLDLADNATLRRRARPWADRIDIVTATPVGPLPDGPLAGTTAVLLRPDGYVGWAAPGSRPDLSMALNRWFGAPTDV